MEKKDFRIEDYLMGRVMLPPWIYAKRQYPYIYANSGAVAQNATGIISIVADPDAYFLVEGISIITGANTAYENVFVQISDSYNNQPWSNASVNLRDLAGKGDSPKYLTDPILISPSTTLNVSILNQIAGTRTFYVAFHGRKIYDLSAMDAALLGKRMWFQYVMTLPTLTTGLTNQTTTLNIFNESDFLCKKLYSTDIIQFVLVTATAGSESAEIMMQLKDGASDQNFFSQKLAARLVVGSQFDAYVSTPVFTNAQGFFLKKPIFIKRSGNVIGTFDNRSTTTATGLKLTMEGCRIFS